MKDKKQLLALLTGGNLKAREDALYALVEMGEKNFLPELILAAYDGVPYIQAAFRGWHKQDIVAEAVKLFKHPEWRVRESAIEIACQSWYFNSNDEMRAILVPEIKLLSRDEHAEVRAAAISVLGEYGVREEIPYLITLLQDRNDRVRIETALVLGKFGCPEALPILREMLDGKDFALRGSALQALSKIDRGNAFEQCLHQLSQPLPAMGHSHWAAMKCAVELNITEAIPLLLRILQEEDDMSEKIHAAKAIVRLGMRERGILELIKILRNKKQGWDCMTGIPEALEELDAREAIPQLMPLMKHRKSEIRKIAARALGKLHAEEAIPGLVILLEDKNDFTRSEAIKALAQIGDGLQSNSNMKKAVPKILELLDDKDRWIQRSTIKAAGILNIKEAIPKLMGLLDSCNEDIRTCAGIALMELGISEHKFPEKNRDEVRRFFDRCDCPAQIKERVFRNMARNNEEQGDACKTTSLR